jgi:hypothetical protein
MQIGGISDPDWAHDRLARDVQGWAEPLRQGRQWKPVRVLRIDGGRPILGQTQEFITP